MANLTVRNIPKEHYAVLKRDAKRNGRSLNAEVLALLADKAQMAQRRVRAAKAMDEIDRIREEIARKHPHQPDSAELIREDRDSR
jgi:plasmid stability protein